MSQIIKSKSLFDPVDKALDGTRVIVAGGFPEGYKSYDEHYPELGPTKELLYDYKYHGLPWYRYEERFFKLMEGRRAQRRISELASRASVGEIITLLCWEHNDNHCHRRLVKQLIEELINETSENTC